MLFNVDTAHPYSFDGFEHKVRLKSTGVNDLYGWICQSEYEADSHRDAAIARVDKIAPTKDYVAGFVRVQAISGGINVGPPEMFAWLRIPRKADRPEDGHHQVITFIGYEDNGKVVA